MIQEASCALNYANLNVVTDPIYRSQAHNNMLKLYYALIKVNILNKYHITKASYHLTQLYTRIYATECICNICGIQRSSKMTTNELLLDRGSGIGCGSAVCSIIGLKWFNSKPKVVRLVDLSMELRVVQQI